MSGRPEWQRRAIRRFSGTAIVVVAGLALVLLSDNDDAKAVGFVIAGLGAVLATVFAFLEVGLSEDRERASRDEPPAA